ncbi:unnamed protein product [Schistosoma turkestanicum]|nr:unnamed protein product [Schistosoma turkestanicum]
MTSTRDSNTMLHLNSTSSKTVKEYDSQKINKKHSVGSVCNITSQKNINEFKESASDRQTIFTSIGAHTNQSNISGSNEYPLKARRSLLDWDSFINLPKKPRSLSLKTDDLPRPLATKTTALGSPIKLTQEGDSRTFPCLSPVKANEFIGNVKLAPFRCNTEQDKLLMNSGYSSSEEYHSQGVHAKKNTSSDFSSPDFFLSGIAVENHSKPRKRRLSLSNTASNASEVSLDQLDISSRRRNNRHIFIDTRDSKKRKLSPSVPVRRMKEISTCTTEEDLFSGTQSPGSVFNTDNSIHLKKESSHSLCDACDRHENHIFTEGNSSQILLDSIKPSGSESLTLKAIDECQQNHSSTRDSFAAIHVAKQRPSLRVKNPSKLSKPAKEELISTQNQSDSSNKSIFRCLYCTRPFSERRYQSKHMIVCQLAPKYSTKKKLYEISQTCQSSLISSGSPNVVNNVDEEISISNGVICQANQNLQCGRSGERRNTNNPNLNHGINSKAITSFVSTITNPLTDSDNLLKTNHNFCTTTNTTTTLDSNDVVTKISENNLSSNNNNKPYESEEDIWRNYRPSYNGPYTCSFCNRVIHNRSNFSRHLTSCKARISLSTCGTPKSEPSVQRNKRRFHFSFTPTHKTTPKSKNLRNQLFKSGMLSTKLNKVNHRHLNTDTHNGEMLMHSGEESLDALSFSTLDKNVTSLINSEDSQHDCADECSISAECHQNSPREEEQKNWMSRSTSELESPGVTTETAVVITTTPTKAAMTTTSEQDVLSTSPTASVFKCNMCSSSYRHRASLLRHARNTNHEVKLIRTRNRTANGVKSESPMKESEECLDDSGCMKNAILSDLASKESVESVTLDSGVVENEKNAEVVAEVNHRHLNTDTHNGEMLMHSGEESLDALSFSTLDKNVTSLINSEDSQHDCADECSISAECHQNSPREEEQKNWMSRSTSELESPGVTTETAVVITTTPTKAAMTTTSEQDVLSTSPTASVFKCNMCSSSYRHRASLLRHARNTNHEVKLIRTRNRTANGVKSESPMKESEECLDDSGCMKNAILSDLASKESVESVTLDSGVVENEKNAEVVAEVNHRHLNTDTHNGEMLMHSGEESLDALSFSTLDKNVTSLINSEDSQHDCADECSISAECHQNSPREEEQKNWMSRSTSELESPGVTTETAVVITTTPTKAAMTTTSEQDVLSTSPTASVFKCNMCSSSYRHRASLLRHARNTNHEVKLIRTRNRTANGVKSESPMKESEECLDDSGCMKNAILSDLASKESVESVTLDSGVVENEKNAEVVAEKMKQTSEIHSSSSSSSVLTTKKPYSLSLRSRRLSVQSNQSMQNTETAFNTSKLNRRKNRSVSPYSIRHPRIEEEISKCSRRSSVSTQSLSDNTLIDDVKSVISNATTIPAFDYNHKSSLSSNVFSCSWCNRSGFKCLRYLQIHRARCSSRPDRLNQQKSILSTNNTSQIQNSVICEQCNREFRSRTGVKVHQTLMHPNNNNNNKLLIHKNQLSNNNNNNSNNNNNNMSTQSIACPGCSYNSPLFDSTEKLLKHLLTLKSTSTSHNHNHHHNHHTNRSQYWPSVLSVPNLGYGCHICGLLLASESRLDKHKKAVHEVWLFQEQQNLSPSKKLPST